MKTLYKISLAIGITEYIYFIVMMFNIDKIGIDNLIYISILAITGFSCYYVQWKHDAVHAVSEPGVKE